MNWMPILIQLISGSVGGNIAGALLKRFDRGPIGNTIAGILGGVGGGQLLTMLTGAVAPPQAAGWTCLPFCQASVVVVLAGR